MGAPSILIMKLFVVLLALTAVMAEDVKEQKPLSMKDVKKLLEFKEYMKFEEQMLEAVKNDNAKEFLKTYRETMMAKKDAFVEDMKKAKEEDRLQEFIQQTENEMRQEAQEFFEEMKKTVEEEKTKMKEFIEKMKEAKEQGTLKEFLKELKEKKEQED